MAKFNPVGYPQLNPHFGKLNLRIRKSNQADQSEPSEPAKSEHLFSAATYKAESQKVMRSSGIRWGMC